MKKLNKLDHTIPIYSPRTTLKNIKLNDENLLSDLTLNFDPFTINVLKNEFSVRKWKMTLTEFILVSKEHLLSWQIDIPNRDIKLIRCLCSLFDEIDLNNNGILEWEEFTNYVIEKATVLNNIKSKSDEIKQYTKSHVKPIQQSQQSAQKMPYKFNNPLTKIVYLPNIDRLAFYEEGSSEIFFMNPDSGLLNQKSLKVVPKPLIVKVNQVKKDEEGLIKIDKKEHLIQPKTSILDILYLSEQKYQVLLTATNDGYIRGWKHTTNGWVLANQPDNDEEMIEKEFKNGAITCMAWDNLNEVLYCGQRDGGIWTWFFKTDGEEELGKGRPRPHMGVIMDIIAMPKLQFLASAGMDGKLVLWDTITKEQKRIYLEHTRGIVSLAFNESLILLFSAGFDHDVCVWNPYIDNLIYKITGHSSPLLGVKVIEGTTQIVTMDSDGNVRVTDIKKFNLVQSFSVESSDEKHKFLPHQFTYIPKPLRLAFCGRSIQIYEYDKNYNPNYVDEQVAICCLFVASQMAFYTPAGKNVKLWSALTGDIRKIFSDITQGEITAFILDDNQKRFVIGDSLGNVALYNVSNGARIKALPRHSGEVTQIYHSHSQQFFLTTGMDNKINMVKDNEFAENELIRTLELKDVVVTCLDFHEVAKAIVIGTNNGITGFYESETGKIIGSISEAITSEEITSTSLIPEASSFIITTTSLGKVNFLAVPPLIFRNTKIYTFNNYDPTEPTQILGISNAIYHSEKMQLFLSDDKGYVKCLDISKIISTLKTICDSTNKQVGKVFLNAPKFEDNLEIPQLWCVRCHYEVIKSIQFIREEALIITTAYDRKVKIWSAITGEFIDALQQNYDKKEPHPIAFKRSGTEEIYDTNLEQRIDLLAMKNKLAKNNKQSIFTQELLPQGAADSHHALLSAAQNPQQQQPGSQPSFQQLQQPSEQLGYNFNKTPAEEFNPFYYLDRIDKSKLKSEKSNPDWKLHINFKHYYEHFESMIQKQIELARAEELKIQEKQAKSSASIQRFKLSQYHDQDDDLDKFDIQHKPIIQESQENLEEGGLVSLRTKEKTKKTAKKDDSLGLSGFSFDVEGDKKKQKDTQKWDSLHRQQLKGKILYRNTQQVTLSKSECEAAYKLAAALTKYDENDFRSLKFLEFKVRNEPDDKVDQTQSQHKL